MSLILFAAPSPSAGAAAAQAPSASAPAVRIDSCAPAWRVARTPPAPPGTGGVLFSTAASSPNDAWAVGYTETDGGLHTLLEHWDGSTWTTVPGGDPSPTDDTLAGVSARTPDDVWAVGSDTVEGSPTDPLIEHWNGQVWRTVAAPRSDSDRRLLAVATSDSGAAWAVGLSGQPSDHVPLILEWNGSGWRGAQAPRVGGGALYDVTVVADDDVWAVGTVTGADGTRTLAMHWNGSTWSVARTPTPPDGASLSGVAMTSASDGWAVGRAGPDGAAGAFALRWDGRAWTEVPTGGLGLSGDARFAKVAAVSSSDAWAVGGFLDQRTGRQLTLIEHWDGLRWRFVHGTGPQGTRDYLSDVTWVPGYGYWATGYSATDHAPKPLTERMCPATIGASGIAPATTRSVLGETLTWRVGDAKAHGLADASGLRLFDPGPLQPDTAFTYLYPAAGTFSIVDPTTGNLAQVMVAMRKHPLRLQRGTWQLSWGIGQPPRGKVYVVQIHRPTSTHFEPWLTTSRPSAHFTPGGVGFWVFRAALRDISSGAVSRWSPLKRVIVP